MGSFDQGQVQQLSARWGMPAEQVSALLKSEGHAVNAGPAPLGQQLMTYAYGQGQAPSALEAQMQDQLAQQDAASGLAGKAPPNARVVSVEQPKAQQPQAIRAQGVGLPQQAQQPQGTGSIGGVRKLFDQRAKTLQGEYDTALQGYQQSADRLAKSQQNVFDHEQDRLNLDAAHAANVAGQMDRLANTQSQAMQDEQAARAKEQEVLAAKQQQIDGLKQDWLKSKVVQPSVGARLGAAISVALSAIGDAMSAGAGRQSQFAGQTQALIDSAFDRDLQEQLRAIDNKRTAFTDEERSLQNMRAQFANDGAFRAYMRGAQKEAAAARLEALAAKAHGDTARVVAQGAADTFRLQADQEIAAAQAANLQDAQKRLRETADLRFGTELKMAMPKPGAAAKKPTPTVEGLVQVAPEATADDRKEAQKISSKANGLLSTIRELQSISERAKGGTFDPTMRDHTGLLLERFVSQSSQAFGSGTPQEGEAQRLKEKIADPTAVFTVQDAKRAYDLLESSTVDSTNAQIEPYGYQIGATGRSAFRGE